MPDLSEKNRSSPVQLVGGGSDDESNIVKVNSLQELTTSDILNNGGVDTEIIVGISAVELKVSTSRKTDRKYVCFLAKDNGIKFGFSSTTQNFPCFKNQMFFMPVGDSTQIWFIAETADCVVAIGEL